jgi:hypothetical protein
MVPLNLSLVRATCDDMLHEAQQQRQAKIAGAMHSGPIAKLRATFTVLWQLWSW